MDEGVTFTARLALDGAHGAGRSRGPALLRDPARRPRRRGRASGGGAARGFGSVRVRARVGRDQPGTTSVFPDAASGSFALPVKKAIRSAAGVAEGDLLTVTLSVRDGA